MDILTHAISGTAIATCTATFIRNKSLSKVKILAIGTLGGVWPDIDAISMWSKFDSTFGKLFDLSLTGRAIYGSKFWYSHHAFFHSLLSSLIFGLIVFLSIYLVHNITRSKNQKMKFSDFMREYILYPVTFIIAYWAHLVGDLPTPSSVWGGIAFLWPLDDYFGGYGKIWWWNNYDIFLLILASIFINLLIPIFIRWKPQIITSLMLCITLIFIVIQMNSREYNYAYSGNTSKYAEMEENSKKEQQRILGERFYYYMEWFDKKIPFHF